MTAVVEVGPPVGNSICELCRLEGRIRVAGWWTLGGVPLCDDCADLSIEERTRRLRPAGGGDDGRPHP